MVLRAVLLVPNTHLLHHITPVGLPLSMKLVRAQFNFSCISVQARNITLAPSNFSPKLSGAQNDPHKLKKNNGAALSLKVMATPGLEHAQENLNKSEPPLLQAPIDQEFAVCRHAGNRAPRHFIWKALRVVGAFGAVWLTKDCAFPARSKLSGGAVGRIVACSAGVEIESPRPGSSRPSTLEQAQLAKLIEEAAAIKEEAAAIKEEAAAIKLKAEKEALKAEKEALKTEKEAAAIELKAEKEAAAIELKAQTEAAAIELKAETEAADIKLKTAATLGAFFIVCAVGAALLADLALHTSSWAIKWRMRRALLGRPALATVEPLARIEVRERLEYLAPITVLLGPTGCGKSTLLSDTARALIKGDFPSHGPASTVLMESTGCGKTTLLFEKARALVRGSRGKHPVPCALVRIRLDKGANDAKGAHNDKGTSEAVSKQVKDQFDETATHIMQQIGYPTNHALLHRMFPKGFLIQDTNMQIPTTQKERLKHALTLLFQVSVDVCKERMRRGVCPQDAAPVLLFDEVHDLIKNSRLATVGGREVFNSLCNLMVMYCVDTKMVRAVATGSSGQLLMDMEVGGLLTRARLNAFTLEDPPEDAVRETLEKRGYTADDAAKIVAACGARLRLLETPLSSPKLPPAATFLAMREDAARGQFDAFFESLSVEHCTVAVGLLDEIEVAEDAASKGDKSVSFPKITKSSPLKPLLNNANFSSVIFIDADKHLHFQSRVHFAVWKKYPRVTVPPRDSTTDSATQAAAIK